MSPSDFGRLLKPFVFLDLIDNQGTPFSGFGLHPHSGIATVTTSHPVVAEDPDIAWFGSWSCRNGRDNLVIRIGGR